MQTDLTSILGALLAVSLIIGGYLVLEKWIRRHRQSSDFTRRADINDPLPYAEEEATTLQEQDERKSPMAEMCDGMLMLLLPLIGKSLSQELMRTRRKLMQAGVQSADAPSYFLFAQYVVSVLLVFLSVPLLLGDRGADGYMLDVLMGFILLIIGLFGPKLYLKNTIDKRRKVLLRSFPDALDLLLVCVESGLAMDAALSRVCRELGATHPEITAELNRTRLELTLLNDRAKALYGLGERTGITAFRALSAALIQTEKFGTALADTLRVMSDDYRQTRLLEAENKANRLPALMTIPLITMLLPALFIIILTPAFIGVAGQGGLFGGEQ